MKALVAIVIAKRAIPLTSDRIKVAVSAGEADSYIGPELLVQGKLLGRGSVRVEGRLEGEVNLDGVITLGVSARVKAPIHADAVSVAGEIEGRVEAKEFVEVHMGGCIHGDVRAPEVIVDEGGQITGRIERTSNESAEVTLAQPLTAAQPRVASAPAHTPPVLRPLGRVKARVRSTRRSRPSRS